MAKAKSFSFPFFSTVFLKRDLSKGGKKTSAAGSEAFPVTAVLQKSILTMVLLKPVPSVAVILSTKQTEN